MKKSPCLTCGACCAAFTVSFSETETDNCPGGWVPHMMTMAGGGSERAMKGTLGAYPRCEALQGCVGVRVSCRIYENRPSICRNFAISWENNRGNDLCDRSRALFGLQPFSPY
ncbi:MAG: YkgJ family cysteine cluster protein [Desulfobacter sp.]|nr:MAG: YkgJ family cysteine cluster protein [Desulfobacter sp.]